MPVAPHLMILLGGPKAAGQDHKMSDGGEVDGSSDVRGLGAMAEDLIHCIHAKDVQGTVDALKSFFEAVDTDEDGDESQEDEGPEA